MEEPIRTHNPVEQAIDAPESIMFFTQTVQRDIHGEIARRVLFTDLGRRCRQLFGIIPVAAECHVERRTVPLELGSDTGQISPQLGASSRQCYLDDRSALPGEFFDFPEAHFTARVVPLLPVEAMGAMCLASAGDKE
jgi:hypothetical protein